MISLATWLIAVTLTDESVASSRRFLQAGGNADNCGDVWEDAFGLQPLYLRRECHSWYSGAAYCRINKYGDHVSGQITFSADVMSLYAVFTAYWRNSEGLMGF